jgi:excisionase family DNA binding protein
LYPKENEMQKMMTTSDVAKKLKLSTSTIYKYAEKGKIPSFKIGNSRRFFEEQIKLFLNLCKKDKK